MNATARRRVPAVIAAMAALFVATAGCRTEGGQTCRDGSHSTATGQGACSHHGGVRQ